MSQVKKGLWVIFKPDKIDPDQLRAQFATSYPVFHDMEAVEYKCWWIDEDRGEWGAFYLFRSQGELDAYLASERWQKIIPEKYGCRPTARVVDAGMVLSKKIIIQPDDSWLDDGS